jgi:hypothetical protein
VGRDESREKGVLLHYFNGIWTSIDPPNVSSRWYLNAVHFTSSNEGWAVGIDSENRRSVLLRYYSPPAEVVSSPILPNGPTSGTLGTSYVYSTGGSSSNIGHPVEYSFDWGDGTYSSWSSSASASKLWSNPGNYTVKAQARCATDTSIVSDWSPGLTVNIKVPITLQSPPNNTHYNACSLYSSTTFSWSVAEIFKSYEIKFSQDQSFSSIPVKIRISSPSTEYIIKSNKWKKVLLAPGISGGIVY